MQRIFKYLLVIVAICLFYFNKQISANSAYFVWEKTDIYVPFGSSVYDYIDDYQVKLYVNGKESKDFEVYKETNCSSFTTVLTNKVGKYHIYYQAYSVNYALRSEQIITFIVYDDKSPTIAGPKTIKLEYGDEFNPLLYFTYQDNATKFDKIVTSFDDSKVSYNILGTYPASFIALDESNNSAVFDFNLVIVDTKKPTIKLNKELYFSYNEAPDLTKFMSAYDNYDGIIEDIKIINLYNLNVIGKSTITVEVVDSSKNILNQTFDCVIVDDVAPTIKLKKTTDVIDINKANTINEEFLLSYISVLSDNYCSKEEIQIKIDYLIEEIEVKDYQIIFTAVDTFYNESEVKLNLRVREMTGPIISGPEYVDLLLGSNFDPFSLITVEDYFDPKAEGRLEVIYNDLDLNNEGTYKITYRCFNSSGKYTVKTITINVIKETNENGEAMISNKVIIGIIVGAETIALIVFLVIVKKTSKKD